MSEKYMAYEVQTAPFPGFESSKPFNDLAMAYRACIELEKLRQPWRLVGFKPNESEGQLMAEGKAKWK